MSRYAPLNETLESRRLLAGNFDPTFGGGDGIVLTDFVGFREEARDVAIDSDGRVIAVGSVSTSDPSGIDWVISRHLPDGSLDPSFSGDGRIVQDVAGTNDQAWRVKIQPDGKIVVAGHGFNVATMSDDALVVRYNADGSLDSTFGVGGKAIVDLTDVPEGSGEQIFAMELQSDGKIVLGGGSTRFNNDGRGQRLIVARLNADGSLDTSFGTNGSTRTDYNEGFGGSVERIRGLVIDAGGRIAVAGETRHQVSTSFDFILARYTPTGSIDTSFGTRGDGLVITEFYPGAPGSEEHAYDLELQADGKLVAAGDAFELGTTDTNGRVFAMARYNDNGTLDPTFGNGGLVTTDVVTGAADYGRAIAIDSSGRIAMAGVSSSSSNSAPTTTSLRGDLAVLRYLPDGTLDTSFGGGGVVETFQDPSTFRDSAQAIAVEPDGDVIVAGVVQLAPQQSWIADLLVARLVGDGGPAYPGPRITGIVFDRDTPQHKVIVTFSENVGGSIDRGDLFMKNLTDGTIFSPAGIAVVYDQNTNTATFTFPGALNGTTLSEAGWRIQLERFSVFDAEFNRLAYHPPFEFTFLRGDANGNGVVEIGDFSRLASNFNRAGVFTQGDFNYSGTVDLEDFAVLASRYNTSPLAPSRSPQFAPPAVKLTQSVVRVARQTELFSDDLVV